MTREEAKEVFLNRGFIDGIYDGNKWREACIVISKWLEQEPATKNDLGVDCISRQAVLDLINADWKYENLEIEINNLPSVTPQEPQTFKWCTNCREYDQEKHCCHRWSKVIRDTVEEIKQEQEPILDKIRAEIAELDNNVCQQFLIEDVDKEVHRAYQDCLNILDKYKTESEG